MLIKFFSFGVAKNEEPLIWPTCNFNFFSLYLTINQCDRYMASVWVYKRIAFLYTKSACK